MSFPSGCGCSLRSACSHSVSACGRPASRRPRSRRDCDCRADTGRTRRRPARTGGREDREHGGTEGQDHRRRLRRRVESCLPAAGALDGRAPSGSSPTWPGAGRARGSRCWRRTWCASSGRTPTAQALRAASRRSCAGTRRYWLEIFRLPVLPVERLVDGMTTPDTGRRSSTRPRGPRSVIALPHMGNWDQAGAWIIAKGAGSFTTVMERLKPETVVRALRCVPRGPGHGGATCQRGSAAVRDTGPATAGGKDRRPALRPGRHRQRYRGGVLWREGQDDGWPGGACRADRRRRCCLPCCGSPTTAGA